MINSLMWRQFFSFFLFELINEGCLSVRTLGPKNITTIGLIGSGIQARFHLECMKHVTSCRKVLVWGRTDANVDKFVIEMKREGWDIRKASVSSRSVL